jgi:hypothetical protein
MRADKRPQPCDVTVILTRPNQAGFLLAKSSDK